ncbi:MAG: hypothetical protein ACREA4_13600 [Nitrososphaera sp.]
MNRKDNGKNDLDCNSCDRRAEIFQAEGEYCLQCWQEVTHPNV